MGGYSTTSGKHVKQGLVYRMGQLNEAYLTLVPKVSLNGRKTLLDDFKVKSEIDLREIYNNESGGVYDSVLGKDVNYFPYHLSWDVEHAAMNETKMLQKIFSVFANRNNYPVAFHCAIGTDRTGVVAFYLNALLGVEQENLYRDYLFSNFGKIGGPRGFSAIDGHFAYLRSFVGNTLEEKARSYFLSIGITEEQINTIREIMLED